MSVNLLFQKKINGGILLYALFACFIAGLMCSAIFFYFYAKKVEMQLQEVPVNLNRNAISGIHYLMANDYNDSFVDTLTIDLYNNQNDSVSLYKKTWGMFDLYYSTSFKGHFKQTKIALMGNGSDDMSYALYLAERNKALSLSGNTEIFGDAFVPKSGVKRAYIEGTSFTGNRLINGKTFSSSDTLPKLTDCKNNIKNRLSDFTYTDQQNITFLPDSLTQSFSVPSVRFVSNEIIELRDRFLKGSIIIESGKGIIVGATAKLQDIILVAPFVKIESKANFSVQIFCKDSIIVGNNVHLHYPSVLVLTQAPNTQGAIIDMGENSSLQGDLIVVKDDNEDINNPLITIQKKARVTGCMLVDGLVDLKGIVFGTITCNGFYLKTASSVYENHLLNAYISRENLPSYYAQTIALPSKDKRIISWLK